MKRFWIILMAMAMAMALVIAIPVGAVKPCCGTVAECEPLPSTPDHPSCVDPEPTPTTAPTTTTTEPSGFADCTFTDGVLDSWHGHEEDDRQCVWHVEEPGDEFEFQIKSDPADPVEKVKLPHLIVNEDIVFPSNKCFDAWQRSPQDVPFPSEGDDLWTFTPRENECGEGPYLLTISVQALKSGTVNLVMTQTPQTPPPTD
jgi:hypothetical protein